MRIGLARVTGRSMEPTLRHGDRVLVLHGARPRPGRLVVARLPDGPAGPRPLGVKRATHRRVVGGELCWWLSSDAPERGTDSRTFGPVPQGEVVAVVVVRLPRSLHLAAEAPGNP